MTQQSGPGVEQLLQMAINNAKQDNQEGAKVILRQVLKQDKRNDRAWMWLAYVEDDPVQRRRFLENAVRINPSNKAAQKALSKIKNKKASRRNMTMLYGGAALIFLLVISALACVVALSL